MVDFSDMIARALEEDIGSGDVTSEATVPEDARARARIVQKQAGVVFGLDLVEEAMRQCGVEHVDKLVVEGQWREDVPAEVAPDISREESLEARVARLEEALVRLRSEIEELKSRAGERSS